jgi:hypothetical protein
MTDPVFGQLLFMHVKQDPSRSYWEAEWCFPPTGTTVSIGLPGGAGGPLPESRAFFEELPGRFEGILAAARPRLDEVFRTWLDRPISDDLWKDVALAGFGVEDPTQEPCEWDVAFEATGDTWLGITIPFIGDSAQAPVVDS